MDFSDEWLIGQWGQHKQVRLMVGHSWHSVLSTYASTLLANPVLRTFDGRLSHCLTGCASAGRVMFATPIYARLAFY